MLSLHSLPDRARCTDHRGALRLQLRHEFQQRLVYHGWVWCPANTGWFSGDYGCFNAGSPRILTTYYNGSDVCTQRGVVCNDDMATLLVPPVKGVYIGSTVGWYNYGWNGYSYNHASMLGNVNAVQITELGYPVAFDNGYQMQRTDAVGSYYTSGNLENTQIGSAQTGGASGGPWLVNFGTPPSVGSGASLGSATTMSVVGVTSYDSTTVGFNRLGASFFGQNSQYNGTYGSYGAGNIGLLVHDTCTSNPSYRPVTDQILFDKLRDRLDSRPPRPQEQARAHAEAQKIASRSTRSRCPAAE